MYLVQAIGRPTTTSEGTSTPYDPGHLSALAQTRVSHRSLKQGIQTSLRTMPRLGGCPGCRGSAASPPPHTGSRSKVRAKQKNDPDRVLTHACRRTTCRPLSFVSRLAPLCTSADGSYLDPCFKNDLVPLNGPEQFTPLPPREPSAKGHPGRHRHDGAPHCRLCIASRAVAKMVDLFINTRVDRAFSIQKRMGEGGMPSLRGIQLSLR